MKKSEMIPAIVLSSHTIGLGVIRALGIMGVPIIAVYYEKQDMGYVSKYVKEKIYAPHPGKYEDQFINLLMECTARFSGSLLIPADDTTLTAVARHKSLLERHYKVACTEWKIAEQFIDKKYTYALADSIGVPAPWTIVLESLEDVERHGRSIEYPCMVKPCQSHHYFQVFRKKMVLVKNFNQMLSAYKQATDAGVEVMLQEFIPGDDTHGVNYNSYFQNGEPLVEFTAEKVRLSPPEFGVPRVAISKDIPEIIESGRNILVALDFYGYSCTEFKKDARDGVYKLMEVNGRHNRSVLLAVHCGINFPWIEYEHLVLGRQPSINNFQRGNCPSEKECPTKHSIGVYWIDEFKDVIHSTRYFIKERYSLIQYILPYIKSHIFATFDLKDPVPFIKRCIDLIKMAFSTFSITL